MNKAYLESATYYIVTADKYFSEDDIDMGAYCTAQSIVYLLKELYSTANGDLDSLNIDDMYEFMEDVLCVVDLPEHMYNTLDNITLLLSDILIASGSYPMNKPATNALIEVRDDLLDMVRKSR